MQIKDFIRERNSGNIRVSAKVIWEDSDRPKQEIYIETKDPYSDGFSNNPHSYLIACLLPAMRFGEKRIFIDAEICPDLIDGLITVMGWMRHWKRYKDRQDLVKIESKVQKIPRPICESERAGFFLSGGIDSLATLRANHLNYDAQHPGYIKDAILVSGLEVYKPDKFELVVNNVSKIANDAGISLIPVRTNIRDLGPADRVEFWTDFWVLEYMSAAFAAIAHNFTKRLSTVYLSSDQDIPIVAFPYGTHPLINPNYSSRDLCFKTFGINLSRFEKAKLISKWDTALRNLRVCNDSSRYQTGVLNCGECEKCIRTKLALLALRVLDKTNAFANKDCHPNLIKSAVHLSDVSLTQYNQDLIDALDAVGQHEIASIIRRKIALKKVKQITSRLTIKPIKEFDRKHLNSNILKLKRALFQKGLLE